MIIEVQRPELEALIQQRLATGRFHNVEDVLLSALRSTKAADAASEPASFVDIFSRARVLFDGEELDLTRDPSFGRPVNLS